jgi:hypothetical protein
VLGMVMLIISVIVVWLYVISELMKKHGVPRRPRKGNGPIRNSSVRPVLSVSHRYASFQPATLYHGTSLQNAFEIYNSGMWLVGDSKPSAVWMVDNFAAAKSYSGANGGIVVVSVDPSVRLTHPRAGVFIYEIPYARRWEEYYQIPGMRPIGVLDFNGNRVM